MNFRSFKLVLSTIIGLLLAALAYVLWLRPVPQPPAGEAYALTLPPDKPVFPEKPDDALPPDSTYTFVVEGYFQATRTSRAPGGLTLPYQDVFFLHQVVRMRGYMWQPADVIEQVQLPLPAAEPVPGQVTVRLLLTNPN